MDKEQRADQLPVVEESALEKAASRMESQSETRRRFIKKAIASAPVILTVTAGPVWARNCTFSGRLSGNLSGKNALGPPCCGWTPGKYKKLDNWISGMVEPDALWWDTFFCSPEALEDLTNYEVINLAVGGRRPPGMVKLAAHAVAALNNAYIAKPYGPCDCVFGLSPDQVIKMVQYACDSGNLETIKDRLEFMNETEGDFEEYC